MNTLFKQIEESAKLDDLDEAVRPIQDILGQDDGGVASIFFSQLSVYDDDQNTAWMSIGEKARVKWLIRYVVMEMGTQEFAQ